MAETNEELIRKILADLREKLPLKHKFRFYYKPMKDNMGSCNLADSEKTITLCLNSKPQISVQVDTLIHEYAHAMDMDRLGNHPKTWGKCYSQAYLAWVKFSS